MMYVRNILNINHKIPGIEIPDCLRVLSLQQVWVLLTYFQDQFTEQGIPMQTMDGYIWTDHLYGRTHE